MSGDMFAEVWSSAWAVGGLAFWLLATRLMRDVKKMLTTAAQGIGVGRGSFFVEGNEFVVTAMSAEYDNGGTRWTVSAEAQS